MMSSSDEEDDQDEEELLQRALAEQAQRDTGYNRAALTSALGPPSRKPPAAPQRQTSAMDDEESEEELLSISSDDDGGPAPAPARKPAAADALGIEDFSDEDEVQEEPRVWSRVDEEELNRRVRAMREAKAAPGGRRVTISRRATVVGDGYGREDAIDPLGLGTLDLKTLTLISDTGSPGSASSDKKPGQDAPVRDPSMREKVMYHSEKFDPKFFLARIHQRTKAGDLEDGDAALKVDLQNRKQQLKLLVKENFECFVSCKNTIDDIHSKLQQIESDPEGAGTKNLDQAIQSVDEVARRAFGPLLERQAQAEKIRSVQGMLQRFRTLFNLPSAIRSNISKGEYDMAVREYKKTKSLVLPSHGKILKRVFEEVEKVVQELKDMLSRCMEDPHAEFSQLENAIRLLLELEPDSDPVWQYVSMQERRIRGMLEGCVIEHEAEVDAMHGRLQQRIRSDARWKQLQSESPTASDVDVSLFLVDQEDDASEAELKEALSDEADALLLKLIRRLTAVVIQYVPDFWRLAISIFNGKFAKVSHPGARKQEAEELDDESYPFEEKPVAVVKYTSHSLEEVVAMIQGIIGSYDTKVHTSFLALAEATVMRDCMRDGLGELSRACAALAAKDCAPTNAVVALTKLQMELMHVFISKFCSLMRSKVGQLFDDEDWVPVPAIERSGSPYAISSFPLKLRDMLNGAIEHMKELLNKIQMDATRADDLENHLSQMQDSIRSSFFECFLDVVELVDRRVADLSQAPQTNDDKFVGLQMGLEVKSRHQRLLMLLSNLGYIKTLLLPELASKHAPVWANERMKVEPSPTQEEVSSALISLEEKILNQYNYAKATSVGTAAAAYVLDDGTQWSSTPSVKGIRDAVVELIHPLVAVHAEVYAGAKTLVHRVICVLFEGLMEALLNTLIDNKAKALKHLDVNGYCQLVLELDYVESVLRLYCTGLAKASLASLRELLLERVLSAGEPAENSGNNRRPPRGGDDEEGLQAPPKPDEILARANDVKNHYLMSELKRTRINVICFLDSPESIPAPDPGKRASPLKGSGGGGGGVGVEASSPSPHGRHRRRLSGSSFSDEPGKAFPGLPPLSPFHPSGYTSSGDSNRAGYTRQPRTSSRRTSAASSLDDDLR